MSPTSAESKTTVTNTAPEISTVDPQSEVLTKVTVQTIQDKKRQSKPISALTAYDYATARLVDESGIDIILVGDSLAMVVMGYDSTLPVTLEEMLHHTRSVRRGVKRAMVIADMPYASYQVDLQQGVANAARFLKEAGAEAVKVEGPRAELVRRLCEAEIPVMGHIGLTPQSLHRMGGYKVQGQTVPAIEALMNSARALEESGAFAITLEGIPREVAQRITVNLNVPTIGIGAGPDCDGQILVFHDIVNLTLSTSPKFARRYADAAILFRTALAAYRQDVEDRKFPSDAESYHLPKEILSLIPDLKREQGKSARMAG